MDNKLNDRVLDALIERVEDGKNILITGQAGTGKTYTLNRLLKWLQKNNYDVGLAGSTGAAAINIGGTTIHRMFGINRASSVEEFLSLMKHEKYIRNNHKKRVEELLEFDIIIIDEISMVGSSLLELIDFILRKASGYDEPFGGVQIIFTGDFLQLPPINDSFAFQSPVWKEGQFSVVHLTKVHRQSDSDFLEVLSKIRVGKIDEQVIEFLQSKMYDGEISEEATKLYARNNSVEFENDNMLNRVKGKEKVYIANTVGADNDIATLTKGINAPEALRLKEGSKVMTLVNGEDLTYVNGSIGTVIKMYDRTVLVEFENGTRETIDEWTWNLRDAKGKELASFTQIPLRLAYAITMHKSQGMTIDGELIIDCNGIRSDGQFYVAISRVKDPNKLKILNLNPGVIKTSSVAKSFYSE